MKKIILFLFLLPAVVFFYAGCERGEKIEEPIIEEPIEDDPIIEDDEDGNIEIIGISQCQLITLSALAKRGFVIHIIDTQDTVTTYTLPLPVAKQIVRSLMSADSQLYDYNFLPKDKILRLKVSFRFTPEKDLIHQVCPTYAGDGTKYMEYDKRQIIIDEFFQK